MRPRRCRLGAWAIGLIHYDGEPQARASRPTAAEIAAAFRRKCEVVGVFVNPTLEEVAKAVEDAALTMVQLNGEEGPSFCAEVARRTGVKVIKAIHVASAADIHAAEAYRTDFHLFDRRRQGLWGGTGESFDWELLREHRSDVPAILAGGLRPENVAEAIADRPSLRGRRRQRRRGRAGPQGPRGDGGLLRGRRRPTDASPAPMSAVEERFGPYGGRYVPETLIAALDELTAAWARGARGRRVQRRSSHLLRRDFIGRPTPLYLAERLSERVGRRVYLKREDLAHTGAHKINNAIGQALLAAADGQAAGHRRDRRRPARRRHRDRLRPARARVRRLHGQRGHPPPGAQRRADEAARRRGGPGRGRRPHPQGGGQRRDPRLGRERRHAPTT